MRALLDLRLAELGGLASALEALAAYADGRAIGAADVRTLVAAGPLALADLLGAVADARPSAALSALRALQRQGERPEGLFAAVSSTVRRLLLARLVLDADGEQPSDERLARVGLSMAQWARAAAQAARLETAGLRRAQARLVELERAWKRGELRADVAVVLAVHAAAGTRQ